MRLFLTILILAAASVAARAEVVFEDRGLYEPGTWNVGQRYDDPGNPADAPGVITRGSDPRNPSGPAVDFATPGNRVIPEEARD